MYSNDGFGQVVHTQVVLEEPASYRARSLDCVLAVAAAVLDFATSGIPSSWSPAAAAAIGASLKWPMSCPCPTEKGTHS